MSRGGGAVIVASRRRRQELSFGALFFREGKGAAALSWSQSARRRSVCTFLQTFKEIEGGLNLF